MDSKSGVSRRSFLTAVGVTVSTGTRAWSAGGAPTGPVSTPNADIAALRRDVVNSPVRIALHRAEVYTKVFQNTEDLPWIVRKGMALREYFETVPLYVRDHDRIAGSISETPGAMPVFVELGIAENTIYTGEVPRRKGYLAGQVPDEIRDYWKNRNLWGLYRTEIQGKKPVASHDDLPGGAQYKFISCQGHLSPSYSELLAIGLGGVLDRVRKRKQVETKVEKRGNPLRFQENALKYKFLLLH
jgi:hypothetical protein